MSVFWDNLIPLKGSTSGRQLTGWKSRQDALSGKGCRVLADQRIEVETGISLSADVYLPKKSGRYPAVLNFSAYNKEIHTAALPKGKAIRRFR
jgi:uncharacterized protein